MGYEKRLWLSIGIMLVVFGILFFCFHSFWEVIQPAFAGIGMAYIAIALAGKKPTTNN